MAGTPKKEPTARSTETVEAKASATCLSMPRARSVGKRGAARCLVATLNRALCWIHSQAL